MRNLQISNFEDYPVKDKLPLSATAWDTKDDSLLCAYGPTRDNPTILLRRKATTNGSSSDAVGLDEPEFTLVASWEASCPISELQNDEILLMHHFSETATTCLVLAGGDLILVREDPMPGQEAIEIVGSIDDGIAAAAWASDEEVLAIVTRKDNLILMSRSLEPLNEVSMTENDLQASKHVSIGWGKKETQFQGKRAKAMRDPTVPEHTDEGTLSQYENNVVSISWRGDGAYFAVSSVVPKIRRIVRVYSREGILDSVSEPVNGLESGLSWRPAGNLIASLQRSGTGAGKERLEIVFFERNGLRHGGFDLRLREPEISLQVKSIKLVWNINSTVLAICLVDSIQFWTMNNYHYYLKQEVKITSASNEGSVNVSWHPEHALTCTVASADRLVNLSFDLRVCRGSVVAPLDFGSTAVVDGKILKLTPLKQAGVPPPMAFCEIQAGNNITDCALSHRGQLIALVDQVHVSVYRWQTTPASQPPGGNVRFTSKLESLFVREISSIFGSSQKCMKLCFDATDCLYLLSPAQNGKYAQSYKADLQAEDQSFRSIAVPRLAQTLISDANQDAVWTSDDNVTIPIGDLTAQSGTVPTKFVARSSNSSIFSYLAPLPLANSVNCSRSYYQVSLKPNGSLFVNDRTVARDCTSFLVTDSHLIFTTTSHFLKFIHLNVPEDLQIPDDLPEIDERCRSIERGAKIVTVMPSIYAVVLQMPRGNLETIYPRVLVLGGIRNSLAQLDYRTAFLACQVHQVDMNILYDYLPNQLLDNVPKFVQDLRKSSYVDEFLSKLKDEDVTQTLYRNTLSASQSGQIFNEIYDSSTTPSNNKVNLICDKFIATLNARGPRHLTTIITAHVCKRPADLNAALMLVSSLRKNSPEEADVAVSHLCFLSDTNRLYDAALSLYDLELTLLVAQNAQRDPREYMPFLQSLQALPALRRQYEIDNHLKQYQKALVSLHSLKAYEELEVYTVRHILYTTAIDLYKYDTVNLDRISVLYAEYLESQSSYASAATLRESLLQHDLAYPLYALAHLWRESLTCASLVPLEHSKMIALATSLATTCAEESRDYRSAAAIQVDYLHNIPVAARLLCKGSYFAEATRLLALHGQASEISTIIEPGLTEKFGEIVELVADCKTQLAAQVPRILELRKKKEEDPLAFYGGDGAAAAADGIDIPDNISLAPTDATTAGGQSLFTRYGSDASKFGGTVASNVSRKTSKTKRREERKRARGKKGSVYEEEYLIGSVGRLIERINGVQEEVRRLTSGMLRRGLREQSAKVDEIVSEICLLCENARVEVWQIQAIEVQDEPGAAEIAEGRSRPSGADGVLWDSQQQISTQDKRQIPIVKKWSSNQLVVR